MKKATLGVVLAMMLALIPVTLFATSAVADGSTNVHIIYTNNGNLAAKISVSGTPTLTTLSPSTAFDISLNAGTYTVLACSLSTTSVTGTTCNGGATIAGAANNLTIGDNENWTFTLQAGVGVGQPFENSLAATGLGEARFTLNSAAGVPIDACIDGTKVITNVPFGSQGTADLTAEQNAQLAIVAPAGGACGTSSSVNLVAGTNFVLTIAATSPAATATCTTACGQVLFVGQGTVPNNPDTVAFCSNILTGLTGVQPALKTLVGDVDPTTTQTIINTQPSVGDMTAFVNNTQAILDAGDASVPAAIADSWATSTASLRMLLQTFQVVGFDLSKLPVDAVKSIVLGANGVELPGVPPDQNVVAATDALTAFVTGTCLATTPSTTPTAATPVAAAAKFTG